MERPLFNRLIFASVSRGTNLQTAQNNLRFNQPFDSVISQRPYLDHQKTDPLFQKLRYGNTFTHAETGCEIMAMYNVLKLTGHSVVYSHLVYQAETFRGAKMLRGRFGTNPYAMDNILRKNGSETILCLTAKELDRSMAVGAVAILSVWNHQRRIRCGLHTFAVQKNAAGLRWYNYQGHLEPTISDTLEKNHHAYIVGYIVK